MKKNIKAKILAVFSVFAASALTIGASIGLSPVKAERSVKSICGKNITLSASLPENLGLGDKRKGALFTATESGTTFTLGDVFVGTFETDFRVYSDESHDGNIEKQRNIGDIKSSVYSNKYTDLDELIFTVQDAEKNDNKFDIVIRSGSGDCELLPNLSVLYGGEEFGIYYDPYLNSTISGSRNATKIRNGQGFYTQLTGSSFCNLTYKTYSTPFTKPDSTILGFDAETMTVYTYIYREQKTTREKVTVLDLSSGFNDFRITPVADGFEKYTVSLTCNKIKPNKTAKVLMYSINGQTLENNEFAKDNAAPNVYFKVPVVIGTGIEFKMPVTVYDVVDGMGNFDGDVFITLGKKELPVTVKDGYIAFTPDKEGVAELELNVSDKAGNTKTEKRVIIVLDSPFGFGYETDIPLTGSYGVGETLTCSSFSLSPDYYEADYALFYTLRKDGTIVSGHESKPLRGLLYKFAEEGEYKLSVEAENYSGTVDFTYYVSKEIAGFTLSDDIQKQAYQNGRLDLPTAEVTRNDEKKAAELLICAPSGKKYSAENFTYLDETGVYTLTYSADFSGKTYSRDYKVNSIRTSNYFDGAGVTETLNVSSNFYDGISGVELKPAEGGTVTATYGQVVDLNCFSNQKALVKIFSQRLPDGNWGPLPKVRLTDKHDPLNYAEVRAVINYDWNYQHFIVYYEVGLSSTVKTMSSIQSFYSHDGLCMYGYKGASLNLYWLNAEQAFTIPYWEDVPVKSNKWKMSEIDPTWKGFTTGEVYLSVTFDQAVLVSEIGGADLSSSGTKQDNEAPTVMVNKEGYDEYPVAVLGRDFPLFDAYAYDGVSGIINVETAVYLDYYNFFKRIVCSNTKSFIPREEGVYYVEYRATDAWGNIGVKVLEVNVMSESDYREMNIEFDGEHQRSLLFGEEIKLPEIVGYKGGTGNINVDKTITTNGVTIPLENGYMPESVGEYVISYTLTDYIGTKKNVTYEIVVESGDKPVIKDGALPFNYVLNGSEVVFPLLEAFSSEGGVLSKVPVKIQVKQEGKEDVILEAPYKFIPVIGGEAERISVVYFAENKNGRRSELAEKSFIVVNPYLSVDSEDKNYGHFDMKKFFAVSDGITVSSSNEWSYVKMDATKDSEFCYVNKLLAKNLSLNLVVPEGYANMSSVEVTMTDSLDPSQQIVLRFLKNGADCMLRVNDNVQLIAFKDARFGSLDGISFGYSNNSCNVTNGSTTIYTTIKETINGKKFEGFTSGYVYIKVALVGVMGESVVRVLKVNGQVFSNRSNTIGNPLTECEVEEFIPTRIEVGQTLVVPAIRANCVLYGIKDVLVSVRVNGKYELKDARFTDELSYEIKNNADCRIEYKAVTYFGKTISLVSYQISVVETEAPVIEVSKAPVEKTVLGNVVKLYTATAKDSVSGEGLLYNSGDPIPSGTVLKIIVIDPNLSKHQVFADDLSFTANMKGVWRVVYFAYDECYNIAQVEYKIEVE